jgi:hypothetical protein
VKWFTPSPKALPLTPYYEAADALRALGEGTTMAAAIAERDAAIQDFTAECMKERGFTYYPALADPGIAATEEPMDGGQTKLGIPYLPDSLEEVERVGYGVFSPREAGIEPDTPEGELRNAEYRDGLSESAREAYDLALIGYVDVADAQDPDPEACMTLASDEYPVPTVSVVYPDFLFEPLQAVTEAFEVRVTFPENAPPYESYGPYSIRHDPRLDELDGEFSSCVADLADGKWDAGTDINGPVTAGVRIGPDGSKWDFPPDGEVFEDPVPVEHQSLVGSQIEIDIAVIDFKCRQQTDYVKRYAQIVVDAQNKYLEGHKTELDQMLAQIDRLMEGQ